MASLVVDQTGCSLLFVRPPRESQGRQAECIESVATPVLDTIGSALLLTTSTIGVVAWMNETHCPVPTRGEFAPCPVAPVNNGFPPESLVLIIPGLLLAGSAAYGYLETGTCRRLHSGPEGLPKER
jgi:hypothetical protein